MPITHTYAVDGAVGSAPGALGPAELDARAEWVPVRPHASLVDTLEARLGSEVDLQKVLLAVLCPLRGALDGPPLEVLLARLPFPLPTEIREGELNLNAHVRAPASAAEYVLEVSRLLQHPPRAAALYVRAVFAAARAVLAPEEAEAVAARLPGDLGELFRSAR
ncbi:DUF2267 domain-containing protein [Anaeromyxobacter oryzae]|uniref:DUF2267 domain-containing protein n=1 Tax=Anaeromyxobacter oryzae TaxID=2918170 RepID=A0ABM7WWF6_9BACT|nr:DUF2267 domain-containing protein [Anaeromyxobacter oryzae]BDG03838.1 hypothetical protein AMOR_28340 [Anaeromyxobacter oryzae]